MSWPRWAPGSRPCGSAAMSPWPRSPMSRGSPSAPSPGWNPASAGPTLSCLLPLAKAHQVPLDELVGAPATGDPRVHLRPIEAYGMTIIPLTRKPGGIQAYKHILPAGPLLAPTPQVHEGYEWLYVLNGRLRMVLGARDLVLGPGEAVEFDTRVPHWFGRADGRAVEFLSLFGTQGERIHIRAKPASKQPAT